MDRKPLKLGHRMVALIVCPGCGNSYRAGSEGAVNIDTVGICLTCQEGATEEDEWPPK